MNAIVKSLTEEARKLSPDERIELVEEVLATLDATDPALDRRWAAEARDRYDAYERGEMQARDLEEILAKYGRK